MLMLMLNCGNHKANFFNCPIGEKNLKARSKRANNGNNVNLQRPSSSFPELVVANRYTNPVATSSGTGDNFLLTNSSNSRKNACR